MNGLGSSSPAGKPGPVSLDRYVSAPGSFLAAMAESVIAGNDMNHRRGEISAFGSESIMSRFYSVESNSSGLTSCESGCGRTIAGSSSLDLERSFGSGEIHVAADNGTYNSGGGAHLLRQSSSPAGLLSRLMPDHHGVSRLRSPWSFSRQDSLPQITEMGITHDLIGESFTNKSSWDDTSTILFSPQQNKIGRDTNGEILSEYDEYLHLQQDSPRCKVRAKRGCATHPRSIAERERRTRISKRLRKLQDLVPNMDKQTSTSDMLDLAVQYIKELQSQIQKLNEEQAECTCSGKNT